MGYPSKYYALCFVVSLRVFGSLNMIFSEVYATSYIHQKDCRNGFGNFRRAADVHESWAEKLA